MKTSLISLVALLTCFVSVATSGESAKEVIAASWTKVDLQLALSNQLATHPVYPLAQTYETKNNKRSVAKAVLFSAVVPGTGQLYNRSLLKSIFFLAVEVGALTGHFINQNRGDDLETQFEAFADQHWNELDYWVSVAKDSGLTELDINGMDETALRAILTDYERRSFSHFLPQQKNQQYYENIGKYHQFNAGWDDGELGPRTLTTDSENRTEYTLIRKDANDNFKRASNFAAAALFNHVLSALEAGWSANRHNKQTVKADLEIQGRLYGTEVVPTLVLGMTW
jgi:hypothetical protein